MQVDAQALGKLVKSITQASPPASSEADAGLSLAAITEAVDHTIVHARIAQTAVTCCVADQAGRVIFVYRMPDAILASLALAQKKAYSAVAMRMPTKALQLLVQPGQDLYQLETLSGGAIVTFGGGVPLIASGRLLGGVGVSGAPQSQLDHQLATIFATALLEATANHSHQ